MQIGHYETYATIIKNEVSKNCQDLRKNSANATIPVRVLPKALRVFDRLIVGLVLWFYFYIARFRIFIHVFASMKDFGGVFMLSRWLVVF